MSHDDFATYFVANGGNAAQAAISAGYSSSSARQTGYKLTRNPTVQRLIREEQHRVIGGRLCSQALGVLESIMMNEDAPAGARVDAAKTLLDRGGLPAIPANMISRAPSSEPGAAITGENLQAFIEQGMARLAALDAQAEALRSSCGAG